MWGDSGGFYGGNGTQKVYLEIALCHIKEHISNDAVSYQLRMGLCWGAGLLQRQSHISEQTTYFLLSSNLRFPSKMKGVEIWYFGNMFPLGEAVLGTRGPGKVTLIHS